MIVGPGLTIPAMAGQLVNVDRLVAVGEEYFPGIRHLSDDAPMWWIRPANGQRLSWQLGQGVVLEVLERPMLDRLLRPIRPDEGVDETLTWAPREVVHG